MGESVHSGVLILRRTLVTISTIITISDIYCRLSSPPRGPKDTIIIVVIVGISAMRLSIINCPTFLWLVWNKSLRKPRQPNNLEFSAIFHNYRNALLVLNLWGSIKTYRYANYHAVVVKSIISANSIELYKIGNTLCNLTLTTRFTGSSTVYSTNFLISTFIIQ